MSSLISYSDAGDDLVVSLAEQQRMMVQLLQGSSAIQVQIQRRLGLQEQRLEEIRSATAELASRTRKLETASSLITINMLDTMLNASWSEPQKNKVGIQLAKFSRQNHVSPTKVPHPTVPGGVNGYLPSIVKAWIQEETDYDLPLDLRYVD